MAKYNIFKEASRRYKDMRARGFIPENSPLAYQDFVKEVSAENRGETYEGAYTASAYSDAYGVEVNYYEGADYHKVEEGRLRNLVATYQEKVDEVFSISDFRQLAEKYGEEFGFYPSDLWGISDLSELINFMRRATQIKSYLFRKQSGRQRARESSEIGTYRDEYIKEMNDLIQEATAEQMKFDF